jgi:uncharacterized protein YggE
MNNQNNKENLFQVGSLLGLILVVFVVVLVVKEIKSIAYVGKDTPIMNSISVNGKGETIAVPDIATFSFSVTETAKTVKDAQTKATEKINNALKAVKAGGVAEKDIKTLSYNINPHYEYSSGVCTQSYPGNCTPGRSVLTGYDVSQTIEVKVRDLAKAGELFDTIGGAGIQTVNGLSFTIDDMDSVKIIARGKAIADAKIKAKKIADDLGVKLVRITSFYDSSNDQMYAYGRGGVMMADAVSAKAPAPEIPVGEDKIIANVSITYEIR